MFSGHSEEGHRLGGASSLHADGVAHGAGAGAYKAQMDQLLAENERLPRKQRYTGYKIYEALQKSGYSGSESDVRYYIAQRRREKKQPRLYLSLEFDPGADAAVDWGEAVVVLAGERVTVQLFYMCRKKRQEHVHCTVSKIQQTAAWLSRSATS